MSASRTYGHSRGKERVGQVEREALKHIHLNIYVKLDSQWEFTG